MWVKERERERKRALSPRSRNYKRKFCELTNNAAKCVCVWVNNVDGWNILIPLTLRHFSECEWYCRLNYYYFWLAKKREEAHAADLLTLTIMKRGWKMKREKLKVNSKPLRANRRERLFHSFHLFLCAGNFHTIKTFFNCSFMLIVSIKNARHSFSSKLRRSEKFFSADVFCFNGEIM